MKLDANEDQSLIAETFAKFFNEHSTPQRVRAAFPAGLDPALWDGLWELDTFMLRVPEASGGLGLGLFEACLIAEEAGRTLASVPLCEALAASRLLSLFEESQPLLERIRQERLVLTMALRDVAKAPIQMVAGAASADIVLAIEHDRLIVLERPAGRAPAAQDLAGTGVERLDLRQGYPLVRGAQVRAAALAAVEEWKLLTAAALAGGAREAVHQAARYATEREAFGRPIGTYQAISHPLADLIVRTDAARLLVWRSLALLAAGNPEGAASISLAYWWACRTSTEAVAQALHSFGGYGLTTEYDIHLYNLRAKALPLVLGDPERELAVAGERLFAQPEVSLPDVGEVPIDFSLPAEARALADEVHAHFEQAMTPELAAHAHYSFTGHDADFHRGIAEAGLLFPNWPSEHGGRDTGPYTDEATSRVWHAFGWTQNVKRVANMVGQIVMRFGVPSVRDEVVPGIAGGTIICCLGFSEPSSGSDVFAARLKAERDGDDWVLNGSKMFTSGAHIADYGLLLTRTNSEVAKHKGLTMFLVPMKAPGVEVQPVHTFGDEPTNITYYSNVRVSDAYRLGEVDGGLRVMAASLEIEQEGGGDFQRSHESAYRAAVHLLAESGELDEERVRIRLARVAANVAASDVVALRALWARGEGKPDQAYGPMSKLLSSELFRQDSADLLDLTAPASLLRGKDPAGEINLAYRHAPGTTIYGGTSEIQRSQIAERVLGLPRSRL